MERKTCLSFLVILILLSHCSKNGGRDETTATRSTINWDTPLVLSTIDWTKCAAPSCYQHATLTMEGLYKLLYKNGDWELEPALAENSELSKNVFTIEIKKNIRWTDGAELVADDFVPSWKNILKERSVLDRFPNWKNAKIQAGNPHQIKIETDRAQPDLLRALAHPLFFPKPKRGKVTPPTLGPFIFQADTPSADRKKCLTYLPNPSYRVPSPSVGKIRICTASAQTTSVPAVLSGQVELAGPLTSQAGLEASAGQRLQAMPTHMRWAASNYVVNGSNSSPLWTLLAGIDWEEPRLLASPHFLPCKGTRLCLSTDMPTFAAKNNPPAPLLVIRDGKSAQAKAYSENIAAQWRALYQGQVQNDGRRSPQLPAEPFALLAIWPYQTDPFVSPYPSLELLAACQAAEVPKGVDATIRWSRVARPVALSDSEVRKFESRLFKNMKCVPLGVEAQLYLKGASIEGMAWTALGTWDFSGATLPRRPLQDRAADPSGG
jgi:ABC-type transport system substrate-binding protein